MTKQDCIDDAAPMRTIDEDNEVVSRSTVLMAMDTYARQEAIAFADYCNILYNRDPSGDWWAKVDGHFSIADIKYYSTAELYDIYQQQKQK